MKNLFCVKDKVVVITGATGILGAAMAEHFGSQGSKVVILARKQEAGEDLAGKIRREGGEAIFLQSDVLNRQVLEKNYEDIMAEYGGIDVLINCAGGNMPGATIPPDKTIFDLNMDDFKTVVDLNLLGSVLPTIVFAKAMVAQKTGSIIFVSSESAIRPLTRVAGYSAAKAAITNFTKYMCGEMALKYGDGIRVNAIAPGFFITEQNRALLTNPDGSYTERARLITGHTPFRRFGEPEELVGTLQWLASDASKFVSGTITMIDGGFDAFCL